MTAPEARAAANKYRDENPHPELAKKLEEVLGEIQKAALKGEFSVMIDRPRHPQRDERLWSDLARALEKMGYNEGSGSSDPWIYISWYNIKTP